MPHVLCVVAKSPLPPVTGSRVRLKQLIESLTDLGSVSVVVAGPVRDEERRLLEAWDVGRVVLAPTPSRRPSIRERVQWAIGLGPERTWLYRTHAPVVDVLRAELERRPDVLWTSGRTAARFLERLSLPPLMVDVQAPERLIIWSRLRAEARRGGRAGLGRLVQLLLDAPARLIAERRLWSRATLITTVSREDASRIPSRWAAKVRVVANGVNIPEAVIARPQSRRIVFLGNMNYPPNADAARWIVEEIFPRIVAGSPDAELRLVGIAPRHLRASLTAPNVTFTGFVEDLRVELDACSTALLAVRCGAGTKLKVLESLAHGVPVVTTPVGNEGIGTVDDVHVLVRQSASDLAAAVLRVLSDSPLAFRLGRDGREFVARTHGWGNAGAELRDGVRTVLRDRPFTSRPAAGVAAG
jgi:glycosyltransferase involved in cell wall biosynthesis